MPVIDYNLLSLLSLLAYAAPEQGGKPEGWGGAGQAAGLIREARKLHCFHFPQTLNTGARLLPLRGLELLYSQIYKQNFKIKSFCLRMLSDSQRTYLE